MTNVISNQGHQFTLDRAFNIGGPPTKLQSVYISDTSTALVATQTTLEGTNVQAKLFELSPSRSAQSLSMQSLFGTGEANFAHKVVGVGNSGASTTSPLAGFFGGIDSLQSVGIVKTSAFSVRYIVTVDFFSGASAQRITVDQGLQLLADNLVDIAPLNGSKIQSMGWDDGAGNYAAGATSFTGSAGALSRLFDSTPTRSAQTVTCIATIPKGTVGQDLNGHTISRINLNTQSGNVAETAGAITGLVAGVSGKTIQKEKDYSLRFTVTYESLSV